VADASNQVVGGGLAIFHSHDFDGVGLIVRPQNQVIVRGFHIFHGAAFVFKHSVHIEFALTIGLERVVMTIDEQCGAWKKAGVHAHAFAAVYFDEHKTLPLLAIAFGFGFQSFEKTLLEFKDLFHVHAGNEGMSSSDGAIGEEDILELVVAGRQDRSALVDFGGVEKIEHREMLHRQNPVHALKA